MHTMEIVDRLDQFEKTLERIKSGNKIRVGLEDAAQLRVIQAKLELIKSLGREYVPVKTSYKKEGTARRNQSRSMASGSEFFSATTFDPAPEVMYRADEVHQLVKDRGEFIMSKLVDIQKIRIGCLNSQLSGMIVNYLVNHIMATMFGIGKTVILLAEIDNEVVKNIKSYGLPVDETYLTPEILQKIDMEIKGKGFTRVGIEYTLLSDLFSKHRSKDGDIASSQILTFSDSPSNIDRGKYYYCYKEERKGYDFYVIGLEGQEDPYYANFLAESYSMDKKVKSFVDYSLNLLCRHLFEFMMERTNQYYYTWMLFNFDMIMCCHIIPLLVAMLVKDFKDNPELKFLSEESVIFTNIAKNEDDFLYLDQSAAYLIFYKYRMALEVKRGNLDYGPLHMKVK